MPNLTTPIIFSKATQYIIGGVTFDFTSNTLSIQLILKDQNGVVIQNQTITDSFLNIGVPPTLLSAITNYLKTHGYID